MKKLLVLLAVLGSPLVALAGEGDTKNCVDLDSSTPVIDGLGMDASRSFSYDRNNTAGSYDRMWVFVTLVDANTSITSLTMTCTGSLDGNSTDSTPQQCTSDAGTITCADTGVWPFASPGSSSWHFPVDLDGVPDIECTFAVAAGTGASADLLTVRRRLCVK